MITGLGVRNFKRFTSLDVPFRPLTVLTGLNGSGKSTLIQALLLLRQVADRPGSSVVALNGPYGLALGEAEDVLHPEAELNASIQVEVIVSGRPGWGCVFRLPRDRALNLEVGEVDPALIPRELAGVGCAFTYLSAERLGPRDQLTVTAEDTRAFGVGEQGQYTAQVLALHENETIRTELLYPRSAEQQITTLRAQVEDWASEIIRPIRVSAEWPPGIAASVIRYAEPNALLSGIRPPNMGFGVSYALPIIVAGLLAPEGSLLIVENPEAHLHPAGQSRMGRFLGRLAGADVQVLVETHSDHVLNGIRLAAVDDRTVSPADVLVHFFDGGDDPAPSIIEMTGRGGLSRWPAGFFDQTEQDLGRLARAKRG